MKRTIALVFAAAVLVSVAPSAYADCITGGLQTGRTPVTLGAFTPSHYAAAPTGQAGVGDPSTIVGLWQVTFKTGDGSTWDYAYEQFHADGNEFTMDTAVTPAMGNVCVGVWKVAGSKAKLHHVGFNWDASSLPGALAGTFVLDMLATVSRDGNSFSGTFVSDSYDTGGIRLDAFHAEGTVSATRIRVQ